MSFNKAFKKRHKLLNPKRALLIFTFIISTKLIPARQAEWERGVGGVVICEESAFATLQTLEGCTIRVYALGAHTLAMPSQCYKKVQVQERPRPLSVAFLPQPLTCTLTAT